MFLARARACCLTHIPSHSVNIILSIRSCLLRICSFATFSLNFSMDLMLLVLTAISSKKKKKIYPLFKSVSAVHDQLCLRYGRVWLKCPFQNFPRMRFSVSLLAATLVSAWTGQMNAKIKLKRCSTTTTTTIKLTLQPGKAVTLVWALYLYRLYLWNISSH